MISRDRLIAAGTLLLIVGVAFFVQRPASSAVLYTGYSRADTGALTLEITADPPVASPGDRIRIRGRVTNHGPQTVTPSIVLQLPSGLTSDFYALPPGATFNLQEARIDWLPVVLPGSAIELTIDATVQAVDMVSPVRAITGLIRHQGNEGQAAAQIWLGIPPLVGSVFAAGQATVGQPIRLHADIAGPEPLTVTWDLGDGRRLPLVDPEVAFPAPGEYPLIVEATNPGGSVKRQITITVLPVPVASFRPDDDTPAVGQSVAFRNASGGQPPLHVFWDFGDGTTLVGQQDPSHIYSRSGTYRVKLVIENGYGRSEAVWDVAVGIPPIADMVIADRAVVGQPFAGQAFSEDGAIEISWDTGDGRRYVGPNLSHVYRREGDYYVTMTADNGYGQTQVGSWVHVDNGISTMFLPLAVNVTGSLPDGLSVDVPTVLQGDPFVGALNTAFVLEPIAFPATVSPAEQLFAYLNAARTQFGLPTMNYSYELSNAAQDHARDKSRFPNNPHIGTDGATAAERLLRSGYRGGYAGEATAWGFSDPREAVEFWINSDSHRPILLNQITNDIGVGYLEDYATANVWHWTAEFGVSYGAPAKPIIRAQNPLAGQSALDTDVINYSWVWPLSLNAGERFTVYIVSGDRYIPVGSIAQPVFGSLYTLSTDLREALSGQALPRARANAYDWIIRLENGTGQVLAESERRLISFSPDSSLPAPTATVATIVPIMTATPAVPVPTMTPSPTQTQELPPIVQPPIIVTSTPAPIP